LSAHILAEAKIPSIAGGNIGTPLSALVESFGEGSIIVAEISEFQLWSSSSFRAKATAFTNIAEDHLDYFQSMAEIAQAEHRIIENAGPDDVFIFNLEDPILDAWASESQHTRNFGIANRGVPNLWTNGAWVYEGEEPRIDLSQCLLQGRHNWLNIMAAAQIARVVGVEWRTISKAVMSFKPLPHRLELCGEIKGVKFYDDSKATNAHAAVAGLNSLHGPLVVIAGGVEKGLPLDVMAETLRKRAEAVLVIGEIQGRMCDVFRAANVPGVEEATTLEKAVIRAFELAQVAGASVVLSPACSSFDMFKSYAHRGEVFQVSVKVLED
jgi:UDP-N-acetylmuramoylalanine--D-glutamate ligase